MGKTEFPSATADRDVALDGLRGVAILLVIGVHLRMLGCGWAGVQLFFVLSGFLITRILVAEAAAYPFREYLARFYVRRVLRILPVLYLYLAAMAFIAWQQGWWDGAVEHLISGSLFVSNFNFIAGGSEMMLPAQPELRYSFSHLWSLAVEEHFYLFWPLVVYAARKRLQTVIMLCLLAGPLLRWASMELFLDGGWGPMGAVWRVYVLSTSHLDAFAAGALVALKTAETTTPKVQTWLGFAMIAYALGALANGSLGLGRADGQWFHLGYPVGLPWKGQYIWGYTLLNLIFAQWIWLCLRHPRMKQLFSNAWLRFTGRISYGLYLIHFPLALFAFYPLRQLLHQWGAGAFADALAVLGYLAMAQALAWLSFRYFEMPIMHRGHGLQDRFARRRERELDELAPERA